MSKVAITLAAVAAISILSGCASKETASVETTDYKSCFLVRDLAGWKDARGGKFTMRTLDGEFYQAQFLGPCPEADMSQQITLITRFSYKLCEGDDATIVLPRGVSGPQSCRIDEVHKMSEEEVAALRPVDRP